MESVIKSKNKSKFKIQYTTLIYIEIIYILFIKLFIDVLGLPNYFWYFCDAVNLLLIVNSITQFKIFRTIKANHFLILLLTLFLFSILGFSLNFSSIFLYLWGFRNLARMLGFWIVCIIYLTRDKLVNVFHILYVAFILNFFLSLIQYSKGIKHDNLGGIFGTSGASNAFTLNLLVIIVAIAVACYIRKEISFLKLAIVSVMALIIAPLAELKAFFIIFPLIIIVSLIFDGKMSFRILITIVGTILVLILGLRLLAYINPKSAEMLTLESIMEYLTDESGMGYSTADDLSRTGAIGTIYNMFFKNRLTRSFFGFGLGNCEASSFSFLTTSFYRKYEYLHYRWFFDAMVYLELGSGGLFLFALFFILVFAYIIKHRKSYHTNDKSMIIMSLVISIYVFFVAFYNSSLRTESGYFIWFALAVPFILKKPNPNEKVLPITNALKIADYKIKIKG